MNNKLEIRPKGWPLTGDGYYRSRNPIVFKDITEPTVSDGLLSFCDKDGKHHNHTLRCIEHFTFEVTNE